MVIWGSCISGRSTRRGRRGSADAISTGGSGCGRTRATFPTPSSAWRATWASSGCSTSGSRSASADTCRARPACGCPKPGRLPRIRHIPRLVCEAPRPRAQSGIEARGLVPTPVRRGAGRAAGGDDAARGARRRVPGRSGGRPVRRGARHARGRHPRRRSPSRHDAHAAGRLGRHLDWTPPVG